MQRMEKVNLMSKLVTSFVDMFFLIYLFKLELILIFCYHLQIQIKTREAIAPL